MSNSSEPVLGERVELLRRKRGLSREVLSGLVGKSPERLRQIERGIRPLDRISSIMLLAKALQVAPAEFIAPAFPALPLPPVHDESAAPIRQAVLGRLDCASPPSAAELRGRIGRAWDRWRSSPNRFAETLLDLPPLLAAAYALADGSAGGHGTADLSDAYRLAAAYLRQTGDHALAPTAADRALAAARADGGRPLIAAGRQTMAESLLALGYHAEAFEIAHAAVADIAAPGADAPAELSIAGVARLTAALAAAHAGDQPAAERLVEQARVNAQRLGTEGAHFGLCFGPVVAEAHAVQVMAALGRHRAAIRLANRVEVERLCCREHRVRHYLTLALAYAREHEAMGSIFLLRKAEMLSPADLRYSTAFRETVAGLRHIEDPLIRQELLDLVSRARLG